MSELSQNRRILIVDDTPSIHEDYRKIRETAEPESSLADFEQTFFKGSPRRGPEPTCGGSALLPAFGQLFDATLDQLAVWLEAKESFKGEVRDA